MGLRRWVSVVALGSLLQSAKAGFCRFNTTVTPYSGCYNCNDGPTSFSPPCTGNFSNLTHGPQIPFIATDPCAGRCRFNCTRHVGIPGACCPGYAGDQCDVDLDACVTTPCDPNALCTDAPPPADGSSFGRTCACRVGFVGNGETCAEDPSQVVVLRQADFAQGTYQIRTSGLYRLGEDIVFNPNSRLTGGNNAPRENQFIDRGGQYDRRAFSLGFFAAITIDCSNVELDLAGFSFEQSVEHALAQRFFAIVELANAPFQYAQGPHNFTNTSLMGAHSVLIHNGRFGRTSHHAIHGNNVSHITIQNLTMSDFEVAGVSINGGTFISIQQCTIGPSRNDIPVTGLFSTGHFIRPYVVKVIEACPTATIELNRRMHTGQAILEALDDVMNRTFNAVVCGVGAVPSIVDNMSPPRSGRPDGSALYGIVLHNLGSHTNGYVPERNNSVCFDVDGEMVGMVDEYDVGVGRQRCVSFQPSANTDIRIENVRIVGLDLNVNEVEALSTTNWNKNREAYLRTAQVDVVGAVYQYEVNVDAQFGSTGSFSGNAISNAQLFVAKHLQCLDYAGSRGTPCQRSTAPAGTPCMRNLGGDADRLQTFPNSIRQSTLDWAARGGLYPSSDGFVICGGDNMFHVNKGALGIRIDAGDRVIVRNVEIDTVLNSGQPPTTLCPGSSTVRLHPMQSQAWYTGNDAVGMSFSASFNVDLVGRNVVRNIVSSSGNAYGVQVIQISDFVRGRVVVGSLQTLRGSQTFPHLSATQIYSGRPPVNKDATIPETQSLHIDRYACIPGDNMEMFTPVDSMNGMMMGDDDGPPDPTSMTCRIIADLEAYAVQPFDSLRATTPDYTTICPAGTIAGGATASDGGRPTRVLQVSFAAVSSLTTAQQTDFRSEALRALVGRMSDGTSTADAIQTWLTLNPFVFHAMFDGEQVTSAEADLVTSSVRLNPIVVVVSSTSFTSVGAESYEPGAAVSSDGNAKSEMVVVAILVVLLVVLVIAVAVRWHYAKRRFSEAAAATGPSAVGNLRPPLARPPEVTESNSAYTGESHYLEVKAVIPEEDGDEAEGVKPGDIVYDNLPTEIASPTEEDTRMSNIKSNYSVVKKKQKADPTGAASTIAVPDPDEVVMLEDNNVATSEV